MARSEYRKLNVWTGVSLLFAVIVALVTVPMITGGFAKAYEDESGESFDVIQYVADETDESITDVPEPEEPSWLYTWFGIGEAPTVLDESGYYVSVSTLYADVKYLDDTPTFDEAWHAEDGLAILGQINSYTPLYDTDGDYYVMFANDVLQTTGRKALDWSFTRNNDFAEAVDGCIHVPETGLSYFPKSLFEGADQEGFEGYRHQLLVPFDFAQDSKVEMDVEVVNYRSDVTVPARHQTVASDAFSMESEIQIATPETASNLSLDNIGLIADDAEGTLMLLRDRQEASSGATIDYDSENGILRIDTTGVSTKKVTIALFDDSGAARISGASKAFAAMDPATAEAVPYWKFTELDLDKLKAAIERGEYPGFAWEVQMVYAGWTGDDPATQEVPSNAPIGYSETVQKTKPYMWGWFNNRGSVYQVGATVELARRIINDDQANARSIQEIFDNAENAQAANLNTSVGPGLGVMTFGMPLPGCRYSWSGERGMNMTSTNTNEDYSWIWEPVAEAGGIPFNMMIGMCGHNTRSVGNGPANDDDDGLDGIAHIRVLAVGDDWVVIGFQTPYCCVSGIEGQAGTGIMKFQVDAAGYAEVKKKCDHDDGGYDASQNPRYNFEGIIYRIYDQDGNVVKDKDGNIINIELNSYGDSKEQVKLKRGNYYMKEYKTNNWYELSDKEYPFQVAAQNTPDNPVVVDAADLPKLGSLKITKGNTQTTPMYEYQGPGTRWYPYSYEGIVYRLTGTADSGNFTADIELNEEGVGFLDKIPFDTYQLEEVETNKWFEINTRSLISDIEIDPERGETDVELHWSEYPQLLDDEEMTQFQVIKKATGKTGSFDFAGIKFELWYANQEPVTGAYVPAQKVADITLPANGRSDPFWILYGSYILKEVAVNQYFNMPDETQMSTSFNVTPENTEFGRTVYQVERDNDPVTGTINIIKKSTNKDVLNPAVQGNTDVSPYYSFEGIKYTLYNYSTNAVIRDDIKLDRYGRATVENLPLAKDTVPVSYLLKETEGNDYYKLNENIKVGPITLTKEKPTYTAEIYHDPLDNRDKAIGDDPFVGMIRVHKSSRDSRTDADGSSYSFEGIKYAVYNNRTGGYFNGTGTPIGYITLDHDGYGEIDGLLLGDSYTLVEVETNKWYKLDPTPISFTDSTRSREIRPYSPHRIETDGMFKDNGYSTFQNRFMDPSYKDGWDRVDVYFDDEPELGELKIKKGSTDATVNNSQTQGSAADEHSRYSFEGITYKLENDRTHETWEAVLDEWGYATVEKLPLGDTYTLTETKGNEWYKNSGVYITNLNPTPEAKTVSAGHREGNDDDPEVGRIELVKKSSDASAQSNPYYTFAGIEYTVYNQRTGGYCGTITLDAEGKGSIDGLLLGDTYNLRETKTNPWYELSKMDIAKISTDSEVEILPMPASKTVKVTTTDKPVYIRVVIDKDSADPSITAPNGVRNPMYQFGGALYRLDNTRLNTTIPDRLETDDDGHAESVLVLIDDYSVTEEKASPGFAIDGSTYVGAYDGFDPSQDSSTSTYDYSSEDKTFKIKSQQASGALPEEAQVDFSLNVDKKNAENDSDVAPTSASLEGAVFEVKYYSTFDSSKYDSAAIKNTWYVQVDAYGYVSFQNAAAVVEAPDGRMFHSDPFYMKEGKKVIPVGSVTIQEVAVPRGMVFDNNTVSGPGARQADTVTYDQTSYDWAQLKLGRKKFGDLPVRSDFQFLKYDATDGVPMPYVPFVVYSKTTGEWHIIMTAEDGYYDSARTDNAKNTNALDEAALFDADGNVVGVDEGKLISIWNACQGQVGTWFYGYGPVNDPSGELRAAATVAGSQGAFVFEPKSEDVSSDEMQPYGYHMTELWSSANSGRDMIDTYFYTGEHGTTVIGDLVNNNKVKVHTTAMDVANGAHEGDASQNIVTIRDEVRYEGAIPGHKYRLIATLMDKSTGGKFVGLQGEEYVLTDEFTAVSNAGMRIMEFQVPGRYLVGKTTVVFEEMWRDDHQLATHADLQDMDQTVNFPEMGTTALDGYTGRHDGSDYDNIVTVKDSVRYKSLRPGQSYHMKGTLYDRATSRPLSGADGRAVTAETDFVPDAADGEVLLEFKVARSAIEGKITVAFEELSRDGVLIASHADIDDNEQTVIYPAIHTNATDSATGDHEGVSNGTVKINDVVTYENLVRGEKYTLTGTLMDKDTGERLVGDNYHNFIITATFVAGVDVPDFTVVDEEPELEDGQVIVDYGDGDDEVPAKEPEITYRAPTAQKLYKLVLDGLEEHRTSEDVSFKTMAGYTDAFSVLGELTPGTSVAVTPIVNLPLSYVPGGPVSCPITVTMGTDGAVKVSPIGDSTAYFGEFILPVDAVGFREYVKGEVTFTFRIPYHVIEGKDVVVFEALRHGDEDIAKHEDINDEGQTVSYPKIRTTALVNGEHGAEAKSDQTIADEVRYENLQPGERYVLKAMLMNKNRKEVVVIGNDEIRGETWFSPVQRDGVESVEMTLDATELYGYDTVVFETLFHYIEREKVNDLGETFYQPELVPVAYHADYTDADQTVSFNISDVFSEPIRTYSVPVVTVEEPEPVIEIYEPAPEPIVEIIEAVEAIAKTAGKWLPLVTLVLSVSAAAAMVTYSIRVRRRD